MADNTSTVDSTATTTDNETTTETTASTDNTASTGNVDQSTDTGTTANVDDSNDAEAQIAELYIATFDRAPDEAGLKYWVEQHQEHGMTIEQIAQSFFDQPETKAMYGDGDVESFIDSVYEHVLDRKPDAAGKDYWKAELENGNISKDKYIIAILNAAKEHQEDHKHLLDKTEVGLSFVKEGLNDKEMAKTVIEQYKMLGDKDAVKVALQDFAEQHKGDQKFDDSDIEGFENLVHNEHMEHINSKDNGEAGKGNEYHNYFGGTNDGSAEGSTAYSGSDSNDHSTDGDVNLIGTDDTQHADADAHMM